jgi:prephenate dehydrogenase
MPIRFILKGDSFSSAHTWRKHSFVTEIIHHVEYLVLMALVAEIAQNATARWGNLLTPMVTSGFLLSR